MRTLLLILILPGLLGGAVIASTVAHLFSSITLP